MPFVGFLFWSWTQAGNTTFSIALHGVFALCTNVGHSLGETPKHTRTGGYDTPLDARNGAGFWGSSCGHTSARDVRAYAC